MEGKNIAKTILFLLLICVPVMGDGMAFRYFENDRSWMPLHEKDQRGVIIYNNGKEKLLLAISFELESNEKAFWIFPIPSEPNKVKIDVAESFPDFKGKNPVNQLKNSISVVFDLAWATQLYPMCCMGGLRGKTHSDIVQYKEVEKWGIHTETITADNVEALTRYLKTKDIEVNSVQLKIFEDYLSAKNTLVAAWISSKEDLQKQFPEYKSDTQFNKDRWPCLFVEFPTDKIFFPLRPTSVYGNLEIPIRLRVEGLVQPEKHYDDLYTEYYIQKGLPEHTPAVLMNELSKDKLFYTNIVYYEKAEGLTKDLWLIPDNTKKIYYADIAAGIFDNVIVFGSIVIVFILLLSYVCAGLSGLILFNKWKGYARIGLWNILTLIGLYIGTRLVKGEIKDKMNSKLFPSRVTFIAVFVSLYTGIIMFLGAIISNI